MNQFIQFFCSKFMMMMLLIVLIESVPIDNMDNNNNTNNNKTLQAQEIFDLVPLNVRDYFIKLHLAVGLRLRQPEISPYSQRISNFPADINIPRDIYDELIDMDVPEDFSTNLLLWTEKEFNLSNYDVVQIVRSSQICFPSGCVNPGDIGSLCCPF